MCFKRWYFLLFFILGEISVFSTKIYSQQNNSLVGDWVNNEKRTILSFSDSLIGFYAKGEFQKYITKNDVIYYESIDELKPDLTKKTGSRIDLSIKRNIHSGFDTLGNYKISNDTLTINGYESGYTMVYGKQSFVRLNEVNSVVFDSILLATSMCFGHCPSMEIKVYPNGKFYFKGMAYTENRGSFMGILPSEKTDLLIKKVQQLNFPEYLSSYFSGFTKEQTIILIIYHSKKKEIYQVQGRSKEPLELDVLIHYLMELYKHVELQPLKNGLLFDDIERLIAIP